MFVDFENLGGGFGSKEAHSSLPIWVKISNILLKGWHEQGIATIASTRHPIHADFMIEDHSRMGFAQVCIEMDVSLNFPKFVTLDQGLNEGSGEPKFLRLLVEYQRVPLSCS